MSALPDSDTALVLPLADPAATLERAGGKGASLSRMAVAGLPVPGGFHITTAAYHRFVAANDLQPAILANTSTAAADDPASLDRSAAAIAALFAHAAIPDDVRSAILAAYAERGTDDPPVAVRSSATAEDLPGMSFAGQQETYLNVRGAAALLDAVKRCWASLWTARAIAYRSRQGIRPDEVSLAVVVQDLVPAEASGIMFTANPVTGARHEVLINAAWGLGEAIVGGAVTPDEYAVDKRAWALIGRTIADKTIMTAQTPGGTTERPVAPEQRSAAVLRPRQAVELACLGTRIEALFGQPVDVEWAIAAGEIAIVQARPITALPEPRAEAPLPETWHLPRPDGRYVRASIIELLPDPLTPLFASLALPAYNRRITTLMHELGAGGTFSEMMLTTIDMYAYYDTTMTRGQSTRVIAAIPRMLRPTARLFRSARSRWEQEARPRYVDVVRRCEQTDLAAAAGVALVESVQEIVQVAIDHYVTLQSGIIPAAYMSESLFTAAYERLIRRAGDPPALPFVLGFDSVPIRAEKSLYDLARWARGDQELARALRSTSADELAAAFWEQTAPEGVPPEAWNEFTRRFGEYLARFGHAIYDLDFAKLVPADSPAPLFGTLKFFVGDDAPDPYARQARAVAERQAAEAAIEGRLRGWQLRLFRRLRDLAQQFAPLREDGLADVGLGWPVVRRMLRELGRRLVAAGTLDEPDDVFWLELDELRAAVAQRGSTADLRTRVAERRAEWERMRRRTPPVALPPKEGARLFGVDWSAVLPARAGEETGDTISGIGASPGRVTAPARVLHGPDEFHQMQPGDVLVAKITTPAWTPLFALASGVVTDVGGPLSHSSIVAREYHIPAVLGTGVATGRLRSGQQVTVDGDAGTVRVTAG